MPIWGGNIKNVHYKETTLKRPVNAYYADSGLNWVLFWGQSFIYVGSSNDGVLAKVSPDGDIDWRLTNVATEENNKKRIWDLSVDPHGNVYLTDFSGTRARKYNMAGSHQWSASLPYRATGIDVDNQYRSYVASLDDTNTYRVNAAGTSVENMDCRDTFGYPSQYLAVAVDSGVHTAIHRSYWGGNNSGVFCLNSDGTEQWAQRDHSSRSCDAVVLPAKALLIAGTDGNILAFHLSTGDITADVSFISSFSYINAIDVDKDGYIYAATSLGGIFKIHYDNLSDGPAGYEWSIDSTVTEGTTRERCLKVTPDGSLYAGENTGLTKYRTSDGNKEWHISKSDLFDGSDTMSALAVSPGRYAAFPDFW